MVRCAQLCPCFDVYVGCAAGTYDDGSETCATQPSDASCPGSTGIASCTCNTGFTGDGTATCTGECLSVLCLLFSCFDVCLLLLV